MVGSDDEGDCVDVEGIDYALFLNLFLCEEGRGYVASLNVLLRGRENTRMLLPTRRVLIFENQNTAAF